MTTYHVTYTLNTDHVFESDLTVDGDHNGTVAYLLQNGWSQSLQDSIAGPRSKHIESACKDMTPKDRAAWIAANESEIDAAMVAVIEKRVRAILDGAVGLGVRGPQLPTVDRIMREIAESVCKQKAKAANQKWPKKAAESNPLIDEYLSVHGDRVRRLAQARLDEMTALAADTV